MFQMTFTELQPTESKRMKSVFKEVLTRDEVSLEFDSASPDESKT